MKLSCSAGFLAGNIPFNLVEPAILFQFGHTGLVEQDKPLSMKSGPSGIKPSTQTSAAMR